MLRNHTLSVWLFVNLVTTDSSNHDRFAIAYVMIGRLLWWTRSPVLECKHVACQPSLTTASRYLEQASNAPDKVESIFGV